MSELLDILIIGAGPAGMAAAIYAKRSGANTAILEKEPFAGGLIVETEKVENYPGYKSIGGFELAAAFREHCQSLEVDFIEGAATHISTQGNIITVDMGDGAKIQAKSLIFAAGSKKRKLPIDGDEAGAGSCVSYCAVCDGAFYKGKTVAVIGGGDSAVEDALYLSALCHKVYCILRRHVFRASPASVALLRSKPNVTILYDSVVKTLHGDDTLRSIAVEQSVKDAYQEDVEFIRPTTIHLDVDGLFIAVGTIPNSELVKHICACNADGYIIAGEDCATSCPGVFAAGDIRTKALRQVVTATADGANAAASAQRYVRG